MALSRTSINKKLECLRFLFISSTGHWSLPFHDTIRGDKSSHHVTALRKVEGTKIILMSLALTLYEGPLIDKLNSFQNWKQGNGCALTLLLLSTVALLFLISQNRHLSNPIICPTLF